MSFNQLTVAALLFAALSRSAVLAAVAPSFTTTLGPENLQAYPSPAPYQSPDSAFAVVEDGANGVLMFWTDGDTYRVPGSAAPPLAPGGPLPAGTPSPLTPVLTRDNSTNSSYDYNGNWLLASYRLSNGSLVGFTHTENHNFACGGGYAEWNFGAVVRSDDDGMSWHKVGLAVADPQPCTAEFGGNGYSSVLPHPAGGFIGYGGCSAFRSTDPAGAPGSWLRWVKGAFSSPGINGSAPQCLPGVPGNACCPIAHWNAALDAFVMIYTTWGNNNTLYVAASYDGLSWGPSTVLLVEPAPFAIAYGQVIGASNSSVVTASGAGTLVYARAPPTGDKPRDFIRRSITFQLS